MVSEEVIVKKATKPKGKQAKVEEVVEVVEVKKPTKGKKAQPVDNSPQVEEVIVKKPAGKITAPAKGTAKPKLETNSEEEVSVLKQDSSSDSELSSASNISDDSDVSGGDDD